MSPAEAIHNVSIAAVNFGHWWERCGRSVIRIGKWASIVGAVIGLMTGGLDVIKSGLRAANAMPATEAYVLTTMQERLAPVEAQLETLHSDIVTLQSKISAPVPSEVTQQLARIEGLLLGLQKKPAANTPK